MMRVSRLPDDDSDCGWWHLHRTNKTYPSIEADISCDYAIVGAGWTGLAAAHRLAIRDPDARVVVIDAGRVGYGAAGRNSGFLFDLPFVFAEDAYRGREADGRMEIGLYREAIDGMRSFVRAHDVECGWSEIGQYHVAADTEGMRELAVIEAGLENLGERFSKPSPDELGSALGTDYYRAAIHTSGTVQINPLALLRAYAGGLPENVSLYERSPVTGIEGGAKPRVTTSSSTVKAGKILVTANAFLRAFEGVRPPLLPLMTFASLTAPLEKPGSGSPPGAGPWGAVPAALFGTSMRRLHDGRVLVRNTYAYSPSFGAGRRLRAQARDRHLLSLRRRFPDIADFPLEWSWGGVVSFFRGANGFFGEVAPGVLAATSSGMPCCLVYGQQLAEYACGGDGDALEFVRRRSRPGGVPPGPIVGPLARLASALRQRREWKEL